MASVLSVFINNNFVQGALWGVGVAVIALIALTVREMWQKSHRDSYFYVIFIITLSSLLIFKLTPIQTIIIFTLLGVGYKRLKENKV